MYNVVKRDGKITDFNISKISAAITKAFEAQNKQYNPDIIDLLANVRILIPRQRDIRIGVIWD